jgi:hypothetical protein
MRLHGSSGYDKTLSIASSFSPNTDGNTIDLQFDEVPTTATYTLTYVATDGTETTLVDGAAFDTLKDDSLPPPAAPEGQ